MRFIKSMILLIVAPFIASCAAGIDANTIGESLTTSSENVETEVNVGAQVSTTLSSSKYELKLEFPVFMPQQELAGNKFYLGVNK